VSLASAHRHEGRVGARPDVVDTTDTAYGERTFVAASKAGPMVLPSELFTGGACITKAEWERRHAGTYGPTTNAAAASPATAF
jgi:hypothetical protein